MFKGISPDAWLTSICTMLGSIIAVIGTWGGTYLIGNHNNKVQKENAIQNNLDIKNLERLRDAFSNSEDCVEYIEKNLDYLQSWLPGIEQLINSHPESVETYASLCKVTCDDILAKLKVINNNLATIRPIIRLDFKGQLNNFDEITKQTKSFSSYITSIIDPRLKKESLRLSTYRSCTKCFKDGLHELCECSKFLKDRIDDLQNQ